MWQVCCALCLFMPEYYSRAWTHLLCVTTYRLTDTWLLSTGLLGASRYTYVLGHLFAGIWGCNCQVL